MKIPRKIIAKIMPTISPNCCKCRGTLQRAMMMMMKMKRLSMDKLYALSHPAKNSPAQPGLEVAHTPSPNQIANPTKSR